MMRLMEAFYMEGSGVSSGIFIAHSFESLEASDYLQDWDRLAQSMPTHMPFQTVHWNRTWWAKFRRPGIFVRDELYLICAVRDGRLFGVVPLFKTTIGLPGIPLFRYLRLLGADRNLTEWRSVICRPEDRETLQALWLKEAMKSEFGFKFSQLRGFTHEEVKAAQLESRRHVKILTPPSENFVLALPDSWDSFKSRLKRNIKESLRHCYNSLKHANLTPSLTVIDGAKDLRAKLAQFYHWHMLRARNTNTVAHPDYFKDVKHRQFLENLADGFCPNGAMKLFELKLNDQTVAYRLGFVNGGTLYFYFSAFDPEFSRFSTMTTLVAEAIKWAIQEKLAFVNLSFGRDVSKTRWGPSEVKFYEAVVGTRFLWALDFHYWILKTIRTRRRR